MAKVAGVRFKTAGKVYYFDPGELTVSIGDEVIVETARGIEFGEVSFGNTELSDDSIAYPLKPILRLAEDADRVKNAENQKKKEGALKLCQEKIDKHGLEMKLVDVEYTFDGSKVIFYFTADGRVDFRELVKDLATVFRMRIELRQIGVRDEAKMIGGFGCCGRDLCCHSWLPDFAPVSIKMAKAQNLSLNPLKISGICGRLMCCLQFENDVYVKQRKGMPGVGERIMTPEGAAVVSDVDILGGIVKCRLVQEEKSDTRPEKLSAEISSFPKDAISRSEKYKQKEKEENKKQRKSFQNKKGFTEDIELTGLTEEELEAEFGDMD